jgi:hypothetical protein
MRKRPNRGACQVTLHLEKDILMKGWWLFLSVGRSQRVVAPSVKRSRRTINGHKVQSFRPNRSTTAVSAEADKPKVHIGIIGHVDHSKTTLTAAIEMVLASKEEQQNVR